jgi:putative hydrolase of the HAD superfamily
VDAVLFDAGNTLIYADPARMARALAPVGCPADEDAMRAAELVARRRLHEIIADGHDGTEAQLWQEYFVTLMRAAGVPAERLADAGALLRDAHRADHLWTHVAEGTHEALRALADAGCRLAVISNADGRVEGVLERVGLRPHFEFVIDSDVVGVAKPDRRIFDAAVERLGVDAAACLYVGDLYPVDYVGAVGAGMDAVLLDPLGVYAGRAPTIASLTELPGHVAGAAR